MSHGPVRRAAVAGRFYPDDPAEIAAACEEMNLTSSGIGLPTVAAVCPHAGWMYSGALAAQLLGEVAVPERVLVIAPNHTGHGPRASLWTEGAWALPGRTIPIDEPFCQALLEESSLLAGDRDAHEEEHAIEVLLPLLAARQPRLRLAPMVLGRMTFADCEALAAAITRAIKQTPGPTLIVASSDMNHYLSDEETRVVDQRALAPLIDLDARALYQTVRDHGITMCGYIPTTVAVLAACALGARQAQLTGYATSADAGGGTDRVVGYAAVRIG